MKKHNRLSDAQKRDFLAYVRIARRIKVGEVKPIKDVPPAKSLAHWFVLWDTHGVIAPYKCQSRCWRLMQAKGQMNLTIKLWLEDAFHVCPCFSSKELYNYSQDLPSWVWKAYVNQFNKVKDDRYVPSFANPNLI